MAAPLPIQTAKNSFATLRKTLEKIQVITKHDGINFKVGSVERTDYNQLYEEFSELLQQSNEVNEILNFFLECLEPVKTKETNSTAPAATPTLIPFSAAKDNNAA